MKIAHVVGARPNFMKVAPVIAALQKHGGISQSLIHTGQHYDASMSDVFFTQLGLPQPDVNLGIGSGSHAAQTAQIMMRFEELMVDQPPDVVLVYGDVNSTVAAALVCAKLHIPIGHVEAGLRSFDRTMPEEINRLVTDQLASFLFTPSVDGNQNLAREGVNSKSVHLVGNVMIDTLVRLLPKAKERWEMLPADLHLQIGNWHEAPYALVTLHRPSNVDEEEGLLRIMSTLARVSEDLAVIFPVHPRTRKRMQASSIGADSSRIGIIDPVSYLDFLALQQHATVVITDSGGIQEETTYLGVPCITVRENTERPVTVTMGTNVLVGQDMEQLRREVAAVLSGNAKRGQIPPLWDGHASERIADVIACI